MAKSSSRLSLLFTHWAFICFILSSTISLHAQQKETPEEANHPTTALPSSETKDVTMITYNEGKNKMPQRSYASDFKPLPHSTINFNALGFLQFGPIIQAEFKVTERGYIAPHLRIPYLGLLYHVINFDDHSDNVTVSPAALGIGVGYKYFIPTEHGAWYAGGAIDYSFGSSKGNDGSEWKSEFSNIATMGNGGFRWRWAEKKNILSVGAYVGFYSALRDEWWYVNTPSKTHDERSTSALLMLELAFGWEH